jgi:hypothetical protein
MICVPNSKVFHINSRQLRVSDTVEDCFLYIKNKGNKT